LLAAWSSGFLVLALVAVPISGCSKKPSSDNSTQPEAVNLGTVEVTYGSPSRHDLGGGRTCVLTAQPMDRDNCELVAVVEKGGKKVASTRVAPARLNAPLDLSLGMVQIQLTLKIKPQG